jgi:hypothetical protein
MLHILPGIPLGQNQQPAIQKVFEFCVQFSKSGKKLDVILENKVV